MCGISGFFNPIADYMAKEARWRHVLEDMNSAQKRRGPDDRGMYLSPVCGLGHVRLKIIDFVTGQQPMVHRDQGRECALVFNGEIYNMPELKEDLRKEGVSFRTSSDTEVILEGYILHGKSFIKRLNGVFAIAVWDRNKRNLLLFRDRLGVKPLFYTMEGQTLVFASELKGLLAYPGIEPVLDRDGLCEVFALGPAKTSGKGVFKNMLEVLPGQCLTFGKNTRSTEYYWKLESRPHEDSMEKTIEKTSFLLQDAVKKQMLSDAPVCTFLSGGLDSSLVTAICARELGKLGKTLNTFSFDFQDNDHYFQSNSFQPSQDSPFALQMADFSQTNHQCLMCTSQEQLNNLYRAVDARDLPCMGDIESSMLHFCSKVKNYNKVALTGECADEIFGGYPWFHSTKAFQTRGFPWSDSMAPRQSLLDDTVIRDLNMEDYAREAYEKTVNETPPLSSDSPEEKRRREICYLNLRWFMATLLDRMDRTSMYNGLEARVPLADHRIVEYIFNVPWEMKCPNGIVKGLLRHAGKGLLPDEILWRKKSPYPKTYDPAYEQLLGSHLKEVVANPSSPIRSLLNPRKVHTFLENPSDYGKPWYGQLMAGPQMLAYMLQVNYWLEKYKIRIVY